MYQVLFDGYPLHDLRDDQLLLRDPEVRLAVNEPGEMSFIIDNDHPYADKLTRLKGVVTLQAGGLPIFRGRIRKDTRDFDLSRRIEVEGLLACLNDSVIPPFNFPDDFVEDAAFQSASTSGNVVQFFLDWLLTEHNSQVGPQQQITLGTVTVADPNNYISRSSSDYLTTMDAVNKKLLNLLGGYLLVSYEAETTILHYYADLPLTNVQEVEFGENLLDLVSELDSADTYTAILPVGKDGLTIADLPDGEISPGIWKSGRIIYSTEAEEIVGGRITKMVDWDDVTQPENLQTKAAAMLTTEGVMTAHTITVKAIDLGYDFKLDCDPCASAIASLAVAGEAVVGTGLTYSGMPVFSVGRYVQLNSTPHGLTARYPLMELEPNILDPGDTKITLGATVKTASDIAHKNQSQMQEQQNQLQVELNQQKEQVTELAENTQTQITAAIQTAESLIFSALEQYVQVGNYEQFKKTVESQFSIMSDEVSLRFTEVTEQINSVDGDLQQTNTKLEKHFNFDLDNGLVIRAGENTMALRLDNDLIVFERNGQRFGWWDGVDFHTGNIVIDVNERAQFGNFAFVPRSNGSMSLLKVQ